MEKVKGNANSEYGIIHEEFVKYEKPNWCFRRHEITREQWEQMQNGTFAPENPPVEEELP